MEENIKPLSDIPAINRFLSYCRIRTVPSKTVVIHAGDLPDVLYYIISGSVEVMIEDEEGNEMVLAYLNRGQFFGEMGLFYEQPTRSAWVRTRNQCELAEMTYPRFRQIAAESPGLIFELATQLATRLDRTNRKLGDLAFVDVTGRVAHAIMDLCGEPDAMTHPEGMQIKVSRQELSRLVGCSREMAGRVLKVLEEQGLLRATGKTIVVFNARPKMKTRPVIVPAKPRPDRRAGASQLHYEQVGCMKMRLRRVAVHSIAAVAGGIILSLLAYIPVWRVVASVTASRAIQIDAWYGPVIWGPALVLGFLVRRWLHQREACLVWLVGLVWLVAGLLIARSFHHTWSQVRIDLFPTQDTECSDTECADVVFYTWPATCSLAYSIGAYLGGCWTKRH